MKQGTLTVLVVIVIAALLFTIAYGSNNKKESTGLIFFYGNTCPHCKDVDEWINKNHITDTVDIQKKEVYDNTENALALEKAAQQCKLATDRIGVPFLYTPEKTCFIGTPAIIEYLQKLL